MKMHKFDFWWSNAVAVVLGTFIFAFFILRKINGWYYYVMHRFGNKQIESLPPGDMGWPLIGNTWSFIRAYKSQAPESFINTLKQRYGETGIYKTSLLWNPTIIVCNPELCRKVLADDEQFKTGYPSQSLLFVGSSFDFKSSSRHKWFRRLTTSRINGHEALSSHIESIEEIVITTLEELSKRNRPIEFFPEMKTFGFKVIMTIFLGSATDASLIAELEKHFKVIHSGLFSSAINIPGFAYHKALNAKKMLVKIIQGLLAERREKDSDDPNARKGIIDFIKEVEDEEGEKLEDEFFINVLLLFLFAGQSPAPISSWATIYLHDHPEVLQKAKEEQEGIVKRRPSSQKGLTLNEIKQMKYLSNVIDEALRLNNAFALFREAKKDANLNGYFIPKGWKVLVWLSAVHMDPEIYPEPKKFIPSRWDDIELKGRIFMPFGAGTYTCPGADLTKVQISIYLHYFLLNYKLEQLNPGGPINYLPSTVPADNCLAKIIKLN